VTAPALARLRWNERAAGVTDSTRWLGPLMLAPAVAYIALVVGVPFLMAIGYSFSTVTIGTSTPRFVGLENFKAALEDPAFLKSLGNTAIFALVSQTLVIVLASILAIALQRKFRGKWFVRLLILLPWVAPITLPLILPILLVAVLFGLVFSITDMIVVYVLTRGGPFDSTQVLASLAFFKSIDGGDLSGGAAVALFLLPVLAVCAVLLLRVARRAEVV